jgi:hypothetical protein
MDVDSASLSRSFDFHFKKAKEDYNKFKADFRNKKDINLPLAMSGIYHAAVAEVIIKMISSDRDRIKKVVSLNNAMVKDFSIVMDIVFFKIYGGNSMDEYYKILGVKKDTPLENIKKAYRKKVAEYHTDKNTSEGSEEKMKKIIEAWKAIEDYEKYGKSNLNEKIIRNINHRRMNPKFYDKYPSRKK